MSMVISSKAIIASRHPWKLTIRAIFHPGKKPMTSSPKFFAPATPPEFEQNRRLKVFRERCFPHPVYTQEQMDGIKIAHRKAENWSDWVALSAVRIMRKVFDVATGYRHDSEVAAGKGNSTGLTAFHMTPEKWLARFIFLESIAGVPGMVAGMVRHLHSLRRLKRDNAWIETLLEEAYNERLHLLTFLHYRQPGLFMRAMILASQGIFFNAFFLAYLISPRTCHRFVGYIEEEAVITYTRAIADIEHGKIPEWEDLRAPDIAVHYFNMLPEANMLQLLRVIRADEAKHREVNHTLANIGQDNDENPYALNYERGWGPHPTKGLDHMRPVGWEKRDIVARAADQFLKDPALPPAMVDKVAATTAPVVS